MHRPGLSGELGCLPSLYPVTGLGLTAEVGTGAGTVDNRLLTAAILPNPSWERRCLRKHKRRNDDEACSAKRRRLGESWEEPVPTPVPVQACARPLQFPHSPALSSSSTGTSCMEVEAAQRRLQEIEERITLEDDDEEEDLDVEPVQHRPVLVMSDSLREGLQQGIGDILPPTVAQSVSRTCTELVLWRPPEDMLSRRMKDSLQRQRKQAACGRQSGPQSAHGAKAAEREVSSNLYCSPGTAGATEEDMEL